MKQNYIRVQELERYLNNLLDADLFEEKAYNGVQVTNDVPIKKIATSVSVSKETIQRAIEHKVQALIAHHGIFCKNDSHALVGRTYEYVRQLMEHNIALFCYHLPLDAHQEVGNNWKAARDLGFQNCEPCFQFRGNSIGVVGEVSEIPFEQFKHRVEAYYQRKAAEVAVNKTVKKIAICSGAGEKLIKDAALIGADCLITGRFDEPVWDDAHECGVSFLALGHYGTETVGPKALAEKIAAHFKLQTVFIETKNPF